MIYVLNPEVVAEDGEWEAWRHASWIPGEERFPSFACLMREEYETFRMTILGEKSRRKRGGPFGGTSAPDRPRHRAERIGPGTRRKRRLTVVELIERLEDPSARVRRESANWLFGEFRLHHPEVNRPELTERLARTLGQGPELDVRIAAAYMLGSSGDRRAIESLVAALGDEEVAGAAVAALHYLSLDGKDPRIADGLCAYLGSPREPVSTSTAVSILQDFGDPRLAEIALRLLDGDVHSQLRSEAAFALAATSQSAADQLIDRLTNENPEIRAAAAGALRETGDRRAIQPLRTILDDPDPSVRFQAAMSLRFLGEDVPIPQQDQKTRPGGSRKKGRPRGSA